VRARLPTPQAANGGRTYHRSLVRCESDGDTYSYDSSPIAYGRNTTHALPHVATQFGDALIHVNRSNGQARYFLVLSQRSNLLSQEAVSFAVLHHLSNMVRYRPEEVERLAGEKWSWLLSTWVPRAMESALLTYTSRIIRQEFRVA
jgi:hypothetical protein